MVNFSGIFIASVMICAVVTFRSSERYKSCLGTKMGNRDPAVTDEVAEVHKNLLRKYLFVYLLATLSDWLQGPFVYALYMDYGFEKIEIAQLFVAGFASSMIFGSFIGGMADWGGRRNFVIIYTLVYICSCVTKRTFLPSSTYDRMCLISLAYPSLVPRILAYIQTSTTLVCSCWVDCLAEYLRPYFSAYLMPG
jgi:Na+/melibiose symporter-like transporter